MGLIDGFQASPTKVVDTARIAEALGEIRKHAFDDAAIGRSCCGVIEIDDAVGECHVVTSS